MKVYFTKDFIKKSNKLIKRNSQLEKRLTKQITLFKKNTQHPSLKLHKLKGQRSNQFAIWIEGNLRALCIQDNDEYVFFDFITHDEY